MSTGADTSASPVVALLFKSIPPLLVIGFSLPFVFFFASAPFPHRLLGTTLFVATGAERVWAMYFRVRRKGLLEPRADWTAPAVGLAYMAVMYAVILEFYWRRTGIERAGLCVAGAVLYVAAVALRYWCLHLLGSQWAIHLDRASDEGTLIRTGPYRWIRHPLYLGACMEIVGIPLMLNAFLALPFGAVTFIPLEVQRAYYEERFLRATYGDLYADYVAETWAFLPLPFGKRRSR